MEIATFQWRPTPLHPAPFSASYDNYRPKVSRRKRFLISASSSSSSSEPDGFSWLRLSQSIRRGSQRFFENLGESVKKETGFDFKLVDEYSGKARDSARELQEKMERVNSELVPQFISWNKWESWKVCFFFHC